MIPCLYTPYPEGADKILVYFHGNAEDIGYAHDFAKRICQGLKVGLYSLKKTFSYKLIDKCIVS